MSSTSLKHDRGAREAFDVERTGLSTSQILSRERVGTMDSTASDGGRRNVLLAPGKTPADASLVSAICNCANTIIGAGTLAVPAAMSLSGVVIYHLLVLGIFGVTFVSLRWLVAVTDALPSNVPRNYEGVAQHYIGTGALAAISGAFFVGGIALSMSYLLLIATSLLPLVESTYRGQCGALVGESVLCSPASAKAGLLITIGIVVLPMSLLKDISCLKFTSGLGIASISYTALYILFTGSKHIQSEGVAASVELAQLSPLTFECIAMMVSAFSCHISAMPIYESLGSKRSLGRMMFVVITSLVISFCFYEVVGLTGYLAFGNHVDGNILKNFAELDTDSVPLMLAVVGVALTLLFSLPLIIWPLRSAIISISRKLSGAALDVAPTISEWNVTTCSIMVTIVIMANVFPNVKTALAVVGSVGGAFIVFIFPAAFHLSAVKGFAPVHWIQLRNLPEVGMMIFGVFVGILCFTVSIMNALGLVHH